MGWLDFCELDFIFKVMIYYCDKIKSWLDFGDLDLISKSQEDLSI